MKIIAYACMATVMLGCAFRAVAIGYRPDPEEYKAAQDAVLASARQKFASRGVVIERGRIKFGEHEILDSFLQGREFYRTPYGGRLLVSGKLAWLEELLGSAYPALKRDWERNVEEIKSGNRKRLTMAEIEARLNALRDSPGVPVKMDDGCCRSSSGHSAIAVTCLHCGRRVIYRDPEDNYGELSPNAYQKIADELCRWGLAVTVDGRAACPDCCPYPCDFELADFPSTVRVRDDIDRSTFKNRFRTRALKAGLDMEVMEFRSNGRDGGEVWYRARCVYPEAWIQEHGDVYDVCLAPGEPSIYGRTRWDVTFADPREEVVVPQKGTYVKALNVPSGRLYVTDKHVTVVKRERSSGMRAIPTTFMTVNGHRVAVSARIASALLAFVQGYDTVIAGYYSDHYPLKDFEPQLRSILIPRETLENARLKREMLPNGRCRWSVNRNWYHLSFLPAFEKDLDRFKFREISVDISKDKDGEPVLWNVFGKTPDRWECDMKYGICGWYADKACRHFVILVTAEDKDTATCRVYETTGSDTWSFRNKWIGKVDHSDKTLSSIAEFWSKDPVGADVFVVTPWVCRGTSRFVITEDMNPEANLPE